MSRRPEIPDGENYVTRGNLEAECVNLITDLLNREYEMRTYPGSVGIISAHSEIYEPRMRAGSDIVLPNVRVRQVASQRVEQLMLSGQQSTSHEEDTADSYRDFQVYSLDLGADNELYNLDRSDGSDDHAKYIWTPLVTAIVEKLRPRDQDGSDLENFDDFDEIFFHVAYADNGEVPDDIDPMKIIHLLQSILYTAREASTYEPALIPPPSEVQNIGKFMLKKFGAMDAITAPCPDCIKADLACIHNISLDSSVNPDYN